MRRGNDLARQVAENANATPPATPEEETAAQLKQLENEQRKLAGELGQAQDANNLPVDKNDAEKAMDAAACIGCGACVAACPNASAMLFTSAKVSQLALLPQGKPEAARRVTYMVRAMDQSGFGNCSNERECEAECPKEISITHIARMNRVFFKAGLLSAVK